MLHFPRPLSPFGWFVTRIQSRTDSTLLFYQTQSTPADPGRKKGKIPGWIFPIIELCAEDGWTSDSLESIHPTWKHDFNFLKKSSICAHHNLKLCQ